MIWPAIDLMNGQCVRLHQGDFSQKTGYDIDPLARAKAFAKAGAKCLHIVDLDGAKDGMSRHSALIAQIATRTNVSVQTGGGIRSADQISHLLESDISRVIVGSLAITKPKLVAQWLEQFGRDRIVLALDVRVRDGVPIPATHGWQAEAQNNLWQVLDYFDQLAKHLLVTDIERDGVLQGANTALYEQISQKYSSYSLLASGGIGTLDDIRAVRQANADGVIIGKALYENKFSLAEAISCWQNG